MKKDLMKITACVFAAITLMTGTVTAAAAEIPMNNESGASETAERTEQTVIEEMICAYGSGGEQADAKADALLNELNDMDSRQGRLWNDIMDENCEKSR